MLTSTSNQALALKIYDLDDEIAEDVRQATVN
jgi:hypothetical protein